MPADVSEKVAEILVQLWETFVASDATLLALKARKPVRWIFTREEEMLCGSVRASWHSAPRVT